MLSVGDIFRKTREKKGITLAQVEKDTRIRVLFLQAVENNDWKIFSSKIYITGVIRNYSKYLGLDHKKILAFFRRDYEKHEETQFKKRLEAGMLKSQTRYAIGVALVIIFILFAGYFGFQLKQYLTPPSLTIVSPQQSIFRSTEHVQIIGRTEPDATVIIFGETVLQNKDGTFTFDFPLKKGNNDFVVTARGANGKQTTIKKVYVLE